MIFQSIWKLKILLAGSTTGFTGNDDLLSLSSQSVVIDDTIEAQSVKEVIQMQKQNRVDILNLKLRHNSDHLLEQVI